MQGWFGTLALGLLLGLVGCGNTRRGNEGCTTSDCAAGGQGGEAGEAGASGAPNECQGPDCQICTEGDRACRNGDVYACTPQGTAFKLIELCPTDTTCDLDTATCEPKRCDPGQPTCDGTRLGTCNESGTELILAERDCADDALLCSAGRCVSCLPAIKQCLHDEIVQCDAAGEGYEVEATCLPAYHCTTVPPGILSCQPDVCTPGQQVCVGDVIKTCTPSGGFPEDGVACSASEACVAAACVPKVCTAGERACKGRDIHQCAAPGLGYTLVEACPANTQCAALPDGVECRRDWCAPAQPVCVANRLGPCASDGQSQASVSDDCAADGLICDESGACASSAIDVTAQTSGCSYLEVALPDHSHVAITNIVDVTSTRRLTQLEADLELTGTVELRWVLGELEADGFYYLRTLATTTGGPGTGQFSSGQLDEPLLAGRPYALGVAVAGTVCAGGGPIAHPPLLTFGVALGSANGHEKLVPPPSEGYAYAMRITTAPQ